jgi:TRAP-type C4-dicarboxylate transport system permease small subunit
MLAKETLVFLSGILLIIIPFLGVPEEWRYYAVTAFGVILTFIGYELRRRSYLSKIDRGNGERGTDSFIETTEKLFDEHTLK